MMRQSSRVIVATIGTIQPSLLLKIPVEKCAHAFVGIL